MRRRQGFEQWTARYEPESALLDDDDLHQHPDARRLKRRKIRVVAAVQSGMISLPQALERFGLTLEEFIEWEREVGRDVARKRQIFRAGRGMAGPRKRRKRC